MNKLNWKNKLSILLIFIAVVTQLVAEDDFENRSLPEKSFTIVESTQKHELNPHITTNSHDSTILNGLFEGLFSYNPVTLEPYPAIATDYRISRDKKRWTITIREDAKFSNGEKITAQSVRDCWLRLLSTPKAPYASLLDIIRGAKEFRNGTGNEQDVGIYAANETKLSIYLTKPANYLAKVLCHSSCSITHPEPNVYNGAFQL